MERSSTQPFRSLPATGNGTIIIVAGLVLLAASIGLAGVFFAGSQWQYGLLSGMCFAVAALHGVAWLLHHRFQRAELSWWLTTGTQILAIALPAYLFSDYWIIGLLLVGVLVLETSVLVPPPMIPLFVVTTLLGGTLMMVLSLVAPTGRLAVFDAQPEVFRIIIWVLGTLIVTMLVLLWSIRLRRVRFTLATQLSLIFMGISIITIMALTGVQISQARQTQIEQVGQTYQTLAEVNAERVGSLLELQMIGLQGLARRPVVLSGLEAANTAYAGLPGGPKSLLDQLSQQWKTQPDGSDFVRQYLGNPQALEMLRFRAENVLHLSLLLTDQQGGLVAAPGTKPAKFAYADEPWWQTAYGNGRGGVYVGQLKIDTQTHIGTILIAVGITNPATHQTVGVIASTYQLRTIQEDIGASGTGEQQLFLVTADGITVAGPETNKVGLAIWPALAQSGLINLKDGKVQAPGWALGQNERRQAAVLAHAPLVTASRLNIQPLQELGWQVVLSDTQANALATVTRSSQLATLIGLLALVVAVVVATATAQLVTKPMESLTVTATALAGGQLDQRAPLEGPVELVTLATSFNSLSDQVQGLITNLQEQLSLVQEREANLALANNELSIAKVGAEEASRLKSAFLANMSHELRTPLNAIINFTKLVSSGRRGPLNETQSDYLKRVQQSGEHLLGLINDILDLSKIEAGKMELVRESTDLLPLLEDAMSTARGLTKDTGLDLIFDVPVRLPLVWIDTVRVRQVLLNVLSNAAKFTKAGSITVSAAVQGDMIRVAIKDTGIGIAPEDQARVFDEFRQVQSDMTREYAGTGLGLPISKRLIEMHGGQMGLESEVDHGSTFWFTVPQSTNVQAAEDIPAEVTY